VYCRTGPRTRFGQYILYGSVFLITGVLPCCIHIQVEDSLVQMLAGMCSILKEEGCALIGGHTSEGADAALGLAVNGVVEEGKELRKGPPREGDVLILTKGIGTGTIMAADMRAVARGRWVEGALASMTQSNRLGAKILQQFDCSGYVVLLTFPW
jgi:selenide, water dikinase